MLYNKDSYCYSQNYNINPYTSNPIANYNFGPLAHKDIAQQELMSNMLDNFASTNSTIDGDSPLAESEVSVTPDGTRAPANRRDPIYTAVPGLKWKSKSKKWVVRWDNPITNRRVYKYFSGQRYGFIGAHKRAAYYLEFLNASVGKGALSGGENPFCRRNEGPPKGKSNKGLQRKYKQTFHRSVCNSKSDYQHSNSGTFMMKNNNLNEIGCGMMEMLSVDNLSNQMLPDVQYMRQNNAAPDNSLDKRHYADYADMFNEEQYHSIIQNDQSNSNPHLNEIQPNMHHNVDIGMLSYPTYIYNPQNYLNQFSEYDERYYQTLPYHDQIAHSNTQYDRNGNDSQLVDNQVKFDSTNCKGAGNEALYQCQSNEYLNYPNNECRQNNFDGQIPGVYNNLDYFSLEDLNKPTNNLLQNMANNWTSRSDDQGICNANENCNKCTAQKDPDKIGKRLNCNEYGGNWKVSKRN